MFASMKRSLQKSRKLAKLSATLGKSVDLTNIENIMIRYEEKDTVLDELLDMIFNDPDLYKIVMTHGASRETLRNVYWQLCAAGAGQWAKGHYVPASSLAFGTTLDYCLRHGIGRRTAAALIYYFEKGKVGFVE